MPLLTKFRVVLDTNIFISGLLWGGKPKEILEKWLKLKFILLISPYSTSEIIIVFQRFREEEKVKQLQKDLDTQTVKIIPQNKTQVCRDPKDNQILDLCASGNADYLVTGDKDLLILRKFENTSILNPKQFLKMLKS